MKKKLMRFMLIIVASFLLCYWLGTWNFSIIRDGIFVNVNYVFNVTGSKWKCERYNLEGIVTNSSVDSCVIIKDLNTNSKYILLSRGNVFGNIYPYTKHLTLKDIAFCENVEIVSKKRWGKLCKFVIKGVNKDCWYESGNDSITFELVEEYSPEWWDEKQEPLKAY